MRAFLTGIGLFMRSSDWEGPSRPLPFSINKIIIFKK